MLLVRKINVKSESTKNCLLHFFITSSTIVNIKMDDYYDIPFEIIAKKSILVDLENFENSEGDFPVYVYYEGEPISLAGIEYNISKKDIKIKKKTGTIFGTLFAKQVEVFDKISNPIQRKYHMFFFDIRKYLSEVEFLEESQVSIEDSLLRTTAIYQVNELLLQRFLSRGFAFQKGTEANDTFLRKTNANGYLEYLSSVYIELFAKHFIKDGTDELNLEQIDEAFTLYCNGSLKLEYNHFTQPLSGYCFLFTEFAFLAVELGIDEAFWGPILPTLVKSQEIYGTVYKPEGKPPFKFDDYTVNNFSREKQYSKYELESLAYQYSQKSFEDLLHEAGLQIFTCFTGNFINDETKYAESEIVKVVGKYIKKSITGED